MNLIRELIDLVLPSSCVSCGRAGPIWCGSCQPVSQPMVVTSSAAVPTFAAAEYAGELRTALLSYKERGLPGLAGPLSGYLADAVDVACRDGPAGPRADSAVLVPIPSTRSAARQRGGNHVVRVAALVARELDLVSAELLRLTGPVRDSAGLTADQRSANLAGRLSASAPRPDQAPLHLVIVDDLVTTGTTMTEAVRALRTAGWQVRSAAAIAATRLRQLSSTEVVAARAAPDSGR